MTSKSRVEIVETLIDNDPIGFRTRCVLKLSNGDYVEGSCAGTGEGQEALRDARAKYLEKYCGEQAEKPADNVVSLAEATGSAFFSSPEQILEDAKKDLAEGGAWYGREKAMVLSLDDSDGRFEVNYINAGLSCSQMLALAEVLKALALRDMGYSLMPDQLVTVEE